MLDLDTMAEKRAQALGETSEEWRHALWDVDFQSLSKTLSDGEVECLLLACPSLNQFKKVVTFVGQSSLQSGVSPMNLLNQEAGQQGLSLEAWIRSL